MNLIERLGGYEKAKQKYSERPFDLAWSDIGQALLEYRREHNIFEVGDKVVSIDKYSNDMIFTVAELTSKNVFTSMEFGEIAYSFVRHAKAEEIKAGRRLSKIKCWSCDKEMLHSDRAENDGFCIYCNAEIEL